MDLAKIRKSGIRSREELEELNMNSAQIDREISKLETRLSTQLNNAGWVLSYFYDLQYFSD